MEASKCPIYTSEAGTHYRKPAEILASEKGREHREGMREAFPVPKSERVRELTLEDNE